MLNWELVICERKTFVKSYACIIVEPLDIDTLLGENIQKHFLPETIAGQRKANKLSATYDPCLTKVGLPASRGSGRAQRRHGPAHTHTHIVKNTGDQAKTIHQGVSVSVSE